MTLKSNETLHSQLIIKACEHGWQNAKGWKASFRKYLRQNHRTEIEEIIEIINDIPYIPDAWRFRIEGEKEGWGYNVLVLELLEVEVTNSISARKMKYYEYLWWTMDATASLHFRVFRMDKHGYILPLITEDNIYQLLVQRYSDRSVEYKEIKTEQLIENE